MTQHSNIPCEACGFDPTKEVTYSHEETIRFKWQSGNRINSPGHRNSSWVYRSYRKGFSDSFGRVAHRYEPATRFRRVTLVRVYGKGPKGGSCKKFDRDNLLQGAKPIVDTIKKLGIILDDSPDKAELVYLQEPSVDGKHYIKIKVEEFDDPTDEA